MSPAPAGVFALPWPFACCATPSPACCEPAFAAAPDLLASATDPLIVTADPLHAPGGGCRPSSMTRTRQRPLAPSCAPPAAISGTHMRPASSASAVWLTSRTRRRCRPPASASTRARGLPLPSHRRRAPTKQRQVSLRMPAAADASLPHPRRPWPYHHRHHSQELQPRSHSRLEHLGRTVTGPRARRIATAAFRIVVGLGFVAAAVPTVVAFVLVALVFVALVLLVFADAFEHALDVLVDRDLGRLPVGPLLDVLALLGLLALLVARRDRLRSPRRASSRLRPSRPSRLFTVPRGAPLLLVLVRIPQVLGGLRHPT